MIHLDQADGIAVIRFDNGPLNVLTPATHRSLLHVLRTIEADDTIRVAILTATGSRAFSAGDDLKHPASTLSAPETLAVHIAPSAEGSDGYPGWEREVLDLVRTKPIVAAIRGWCLGQGFIYASHLADIRVASTEARFGLPEIAYGMNGGAAMAQLLRHVPHAIAMRMALTGDPVSAADAKAFHFLNEVVADDEVETVARGIAARIARHPLNAIRLEMDTLRKAADLPAAAARDYARHAYQLSLFGLAATAPLAAGEDE